MLLGIDFGTTHTVVACVDRGNYPVLTFDEGATIPSLIAVAKKDKGLRYGFEAAALSNDPSWTILRSFKRLLQNAGPNSEIEVAGRRFGREDLLARYLAYVRKAILNRSNEEIPKAETLETAISVPANASSAQRLLTMDAFRRAGFHVTALLNEPSASGLEYAHHYRKLLTRNRTKVLVFDMGGGTFDAATVFMAQTDHSVMKTAGISHLGGDDFDESILEMVRAQLSPPPSDDPEILLEECRRGKETVVANARRLVVDLPGREAPVVLPLADVAERCLPLIERSLDAMEPLLQDGGIDEVASVYVVGGATMFPPIYRELRRRFGSHRVKRSAYPFASTAIGLAIYQDSDTDISVTENLTRHFGVFRESDHGRKVFWDPIFAKETALPKKGEPPLSASRRYEAVHNIGHYRFIECSDLVDSDPAGDVSPWDEVRFPFDPALWETADLSTVPVRMLDYPGPMVEEQYTCSSSGTLDVTIKLPDHDFSRTYRLARQGSELLTRKIKTKAGRKHAKRRKTKEPSG